MTLRCSDESTGQPVTWEREFDVVVRARDFSETVVRLRRKASTRLTVDPMIVTGPAFLVIAFYQQLYPSNQLRRVRQFRDRQIGGETGLGCCCGGLGETSLRL
jgi:hypothetical protein